MSRSSASTSSSTMSSTLWAHLLNKDVAASGPGLKTGLASLGLTAPAPADKTGTSVRILLYDTQATIEKFSERVDRLLSEAEDSRQKLLARNEEVNDEVERLVRRVIQEQVGRTETTLRSCVGEPAQASALAGLRHSVSSSLDALNQKVEAVQNLAHINTQALQTIKDQQFQILTAIIPLLPTLQKFHLHITSTEANLKEAIRKSAATATVAGTDFTNTDSISGSRKRKSSKNPNQYTPSPSATKRKRIRIDSSCTVQQQLSSSMQPPTPRMLPTTPSRRQSIFRSGKSAQPTPSLSQKRESMLGTSATPQSARPVSSAHLTTPAPSHAINYSKDAFKVPTQFPIHTPLRTNSERFNGHSTRPSAPPPSSVGFSVRRGKRFIPVNDEEDDEISDD